MRDVEAIYREALGVNHVAALQAVFDAGVAYGSVTVREALPTEDKQTALTETPADVPEHPWDRFVEQLHL